MSSRSFRRRKNRRKNKPGPEAPARPPLGGQAHPREKPPAGGRGKQKRESPQRTGSKREPAHDQPARRETPLIVPDCPVCEKPVRELAAALTHRATGKPAHFDCIIREIREANQLSPQERLCYLGGGTFGVLEFRPPGGGGKFVITRRIPYEEKESPQDWKKPLLVSS